MAEILHRPEGDFQVVLEKTDNPSMKKPWIFRVSSPRKGHEERGAARSRRAADKKIRRFVAEEVAEIGREAAKEKAQAEMIRLLRRSGIENHEAGLLCKRDKIRCKKEGPGQVIISFYASLGGRGWASEIFSDGQRVASASACRSRRGAERQARAELQKLYEQRATSAL